MDDYRYQKRQKMRARRRRAQRIKMTGMCIATLIVFILLHHRRVCRRSASGGLLRPQSDLHEPSLRAGSPFPSISHSTSVVPSARATGSRRCGSTVSCRERTAIGKWTCRRSRAAVVLARTRFPSRWT